MDPAQLVRMYAADVFALCRAMVRQTQVAEDLAQDTFAKAFAALDGYRAEASPRTWLLKIARNACLDHLARAKRAPWGPDPDPEPDNHVMQQPAPYDLLANRDDAERAMAVLAETERALVVLHYGHGVGYPELAGSFGLAQGAVRMRMSRALAKMRGALAVAEEAEAAMDLDAARSAPASRSAAYDDLESLDEGEAGFFDEVEPAPRLFPAIFEAPPPRLLARLDALLRR